MTYISENMTTEEALRLHGDSLPAAWRGRVERDGEASAELDKTLDRVWELEARLDRILTSIKTMRASQRYAKRADLVALIDEVVRECSMEE